ncbi:acylphosphatase [Candidatus Microgenomates bacterium]|nr:MAG: acylphosphatase [Candidatus Microgenomates bacterium]
MKHLQLTIFGVVQNVGFRSWFARKARKLGIVGWVKNNPEGTVVAYCSGDAKAIEEIIKFAHHGPPLAEVVEVRRETIEGENLSFTDFRVVH